MAQSRVHRLSLHSFGDCDRVLAHAVTKSQQVNNCFCMKINEMPVDQGLEDAALNDFQARSRVIDSLSGDEQDKEREKRSEERRVGKSVDLGGRRIFFKMYVIIKKSLIK